MGIILLQPCPVGADDSTAQDEEASNVYMPGCASHGWIRLVFARSGSNSTRSTDCGSGGRFPVGTGSN